MAGGGVGALSLGTVLAACTKGVVGGGSTRRVVDFANWPLYIDRAKDPDGNPYSPSLRRFALDTGIDVNYRQVIEDPEAFFRQIEGWLVAGEPTGWDVMVITNGPTLTTLMDLRYLEPLPQGQRPNFDANASDTVKDPAYDPNNRFTMPWQSAITGIAYDPRLTNRPVTSLRDLFDPAFKGRVGMFGDDTDQPNLALLAVGADPETSTPDDWQRAAALLTRQRAEGIVRGYSQQGYVKALSRGEFAITMARSGDIFRQKRAGLAPGIEFVVPREGALIRIDSMCIPKSALHPEDAIKLMDYVYRPEIAALITASVGYISPVPAARAQILKMAGRAPGSQAEELQHLANSSLVFPSAKDTARLHTYRVLDHEDEILEWDRIFSPFFA